MASKTNPVYAQLAAGTAKNAYNLALSDWFNPPLIHEITRQGGRIQVNAADNVQLAKVRLVIVHPQRQTLKQGEVAQVNNVWWEFEPTAPTAGKVIAEAFDLAGNCTKHES